jgi:hypothetical protein
MMLTPLDARRRWFGTMFLLLALGLLIWGATLLNGFLMRHRLLFVLYWAGCAFFTGLALLNALLDMIIMRRRTRQEQINLAEKTFAELEAKKKEERAK